MNRVLISGRIVRDPDIKATTNNMTVARFTLAVDRKYKKDGESTADFINCIAFGKTAEVIEKHCSKGVKIIVEGHWQTGSYKNKDGATVYTNDCAVESLEFCEKKNSSSQSQQSAPSNNSFMDLPDGIDEELPFN